MSACWRSRLSRQVLTALMVNGVDSYVLLVEAEYLVCRAGAITRVSRHVNALALEMDI